MSIWEPATKAQTDALRSRAEILLFGGSAGSLKSHTLLLDALVEYEIPTFRGILFRQTFPQLSEVVEKTMRLYLPFGAKYNEQKKTWVFPSSAKLQLGYMEADKDVFQYWGKEFSWIGFDESTMHTEYQIRTILSRLRSTDERLKRRARLATNPGGPGASFQQQIFLRGACPIHEPKKCAVPGQLYSDRVWPSDGKKIPFSVAFIPGKLSDHNLLGQSYVDQLQMQAGALADQLAEGCWCELSGAYYGKVWRREKHVIPAGKINPQYWWQWWIAVDYGFGQSWAAAGLYVKSPPMEGFPEGRIYKIGELCVPNTPIFDFAKLVIDNFVLPMSQGKRRNIVMVYADPANFKANYDRRIGGGHTVADQLNEALAPYGLACTPAANDRIGGWQLVYQLLSNQAFTVSDFCPMTAESIRTRVHDPARSGDILKIPGDNLDDVADETRYALYSFINQPEKPKEMRIMEAVKPFADAGDFTNVHAAAQRIQHQIEHEETPAPVSARQKMRQTGRFRR